MCSSSDERSERAQQTNRRGDLLQAAGAPERGQGAAELLDLLTPIVKSWPSEFGLRANESAIQVLGGAGYTRDYPVERLYRDIRVERIWEGASEIQKVIIAGQIKKRGLKVYAGLE